MELKRIAYTVTVETSNDNPVPTAEDVARNTLRLRNDFPDVAVFVTNARETDMVQAGTWGAGYSFVKHTIVEVVDNDHETFDRVIDAVRIAFGDSVKSHAERAGERVYRIVALKLGITPVGSVGWNNPKRHDTFADVFMRSLMLSPADDTSGMWAEIGQHYLDKIAEGN